MAPTKKFEEDDFGAFLALLPKQHEGHALRHVVEVRHESFHDPRFVALLRKAGVAVCFAGVLVAGVFLTAARDAVRFCRSRTWRTAPSVRVSR